MSFIEYIEFCSLLYSPEYPLVASHQHLPLRREVVLLRVRRHRRVLVGPAQRVRAGVEGPVAELRLSGNLGPFSKD